MPARALARVNLGAIERNVAVLRDSLERGAELCAVVKADGYGHGAAHAASNGSMSLASNAPITPESTSPVPAVASAAAPPRLTATRPAGSAIRVSSPFSTTIACARRAASRALSRRLADTARLSVPSSRASSPACGVSTVGAGRLASVSSAPAWAFRPSASSSSGRSAEAAISRAASSASSARPKPGPRSIAVERG